MTTLMEYKTLNDKVLSVSSKVLVEQLSVQELIDLVLHSDNDFAIINSRQELISRGKDDIQLRITIKKTCKTTINDQESILKKLDTENNPDKNTIKLYKTKFLNTLSLLDKLQLEWQKHDLFLKH